MIHEQRSGTCARLPAAYARPPPAAAATAPHHLLQLGGGVHAILYDTDDVQVSVTAGDIKGRVSFLDSVGRNNKIIMT